jgi:aspartate/methionine/tyrosine aminotransferase
MLRPSINIIPVYTKSVCDLEHPRGLLSESLVPALETALSSCVDQSRAKALLVTNAHNPFAQCYPERILREAMEWCAEKGMHYISDEVYALSDFSRTGPAVHINGNGDVGSHEVLTPPSDGTTTPDAGLGDGTSEPKPQPDDSACFISALSINLDANKTPPVSVIWSTSKDLGSSGLRVGVHVLRPPPHPPSPPSAQINSDADDTNTPSPLPNTPTISPPTATPQASLLTTSLALLSTTQLPTISMLLTRSLLTSPAFDALVATNRQRLRASHDIITRRLREWGVAFIPATSGPFLVANLGVAKSKAGLDGGGNAGFEYRRRVSHSHGGVGEVGDVAAVLGGGKRRRGSEEGGGGDVPGAKRQRVAPPSAVEDGVNVVEMLRRKAMVLVSPAKGFHMRGAGPGQALDEGWVRITFAVPLDVLEAALKRIGDALGFEKSKTMVGQVEIM